MFNHLVIATDGSQASEKAVAQGLALARQLGARVTMVTVTEPLPPMMAGDALAVSLQEFAKAAEAHADRVLSGAAAAAGSSGVPCEVVHVRDRFPAEGIIETAKGRGGDLIVVGSHGRRGVSKLLLGSQANSIVTQSSIPVLVCR
jgi:nucleotide-binding universal stress UspA family protein